MRIATSGTVFALSLALAAPAIADEPKPAPPAAPAPPPPARKAKPPEHPDAPPPPPAPGLAPPPPAAAPGPVFTTEPTLTAVKEPPLAGWRGAFFLRDPSDYFRLYPKGRLHVDFNSFPGAPTGRAADGGVGLQPRLVARSLRVELAGQLLQSWTFLAGVEFGGQALTNADGKSQQSAASAGVDPTKDTARYAPVEVTGPNAQLTDAYINYSVCRCLNFMVGQHDVAFSMENETTENAGTFMARSVGVRSFAATSKKEIGLTVWGDLFDGRLAYGLEVLMGDGANRPQVDSTVDLSGRVFARPLLGSDGALDKLQIGVSGRWGQRDPKFVGYDLSPITTGQGFSLWQPAYRDSLGRTLHVLPSGEQDAIGGELRLPISIFDIRAEAYYVMRNTREVVDGYQLRADAAGKPYTERLGAMSGVGWYVQASAWPLGDRFVTGDPGFFRPTTVDLNKEPEKPKRGLEVAVRVSGLNASYDANSRDGGADVNTATKASGSGIDVFEYAFGLNYWYTKNLRASLNYTLYHTPDSGSSKNRAVVPGNLAGDAKEHVLHELGARIGVWF